MEEWIVPVDAVGRIRLQPAEEEELFGFAIPERQSATGLKAHDISWDARLIVIGLALD